VHAPIVRDGPRRPICFRGALRYADFDPGFGGHTLTVRVRRQFLVFAVALVSIAAVPAETARAVAPIKATTKPEGSAFVQAGIIKNDAPDPAAKLFGTKYYVYTTGTEWGNHIGILRSNSPNTGYKTITGQPFGSSAFPSIHWTQPIRPWQVAGRTQAPGVFQWAGKYVMYYAAKTNSSAGHGGRYCISVATSSSPAGPFVDNTTQPFLCMDSECGVIDPQPWSYSGKAFLYFKSYDDDCHTAQDSKIWVVRLTASGLGFATAPKAIINQKYLPSNTQTVENPQMFMVGSEFVLLYSRGNWDSAGYSQSYSVCNGPLGPCGGQRNTIRGSYCGTVKCVRGPGGGTVVRGLNGTLWLVYHGWQGPGNCTSYAVAGCLRKLFVTRLNV
jgi:hypothetical protein